MIKHVLIVFFCLFPFSAFAQNTQEQIESYPNFIFAWSAGPGGYFEHNAFIFGISTSPTLEFHLKKGIYLQTSPVYNYYFRWKEYFLTFPIHIKKQFKNGFGVFAGPCVSWDIPSFWSFGISGGINYQIGPYSNLKLSAFTHNLFRYSIDYFIVPMNLSYQHTISPVSRKKSQE